jgi:CRP/FNR family cyclic AMP-dependent transcriptional regulator
MVAKAPARVTEELSRAMCATPIMTEVRRAAVEDLASSGALRSYRRGTYLFHQGDPADFVLFLWKGRIEVSSTSQTGHRQLLTTLDEPQFFGELGVLGGEHRTATALALEEATVWVLSAERFLGFLGKHFEATQALLRSMAKQIEAHEAFVEDLLHLDLKGRVAKRLLQLVTPSLEHLPPDGTVLPAVVTHADLASLCGGSRENVTRVLSEFQRRGLIERDGRRYVLRRVDGLSRLAGL